MTLESKSLNKLIRFASPSTSKSTLSIEDSIYSFNENPFSYYTFEEFKEKKYILPTNDVIKSVFEDTLHMIQLVDQRDYQDHSTDLNKWYYKTPWERFGKPKTFTFDAEFQGSNASMTKLLSDSARLCQVLTVIKDELLYEGTFDKLTEFMNGVKKMKIDDDILIRCNEMDRYEKLRKDVERLDNQINNNDHFDIIEDMKNKCIDTRMKNEIQTMYVEQWENFCCEQRKAIEDMKINAIGSEITETRKKINMEKSVHTNIEEYLWETNYDLKKEIEYWTNRYAEDYQNKTTEIIKTKENREELKVLMTDLTAVYNQRQKEIDDYLVVKEQRRLAEEKRLQEELERIQQEELDRQLQEELERQQHEEEMQATLQATDNKAKPKAQPQRKTA